MTHSGQRGRGKAAPRASAARVDLCVSLRWRARARRDRIIYVAALFAAGASAARLAMSSTLMAPVPSIAAVLAGQLRTLSETLVQRESYQALVRPTHAAVFAHVSFEHSYAPWHKLNGDVHHIDAEQKERIINAIRDLFKPVYFQIASDSEVEQNSRWVGRTDGAAGEQSVLFFRWLLLLEAIRLEENRRGSKFSLVLRWRPDVVLLCELPADVLRWMHGYSAVQAGDQAIVMTRSAATVALSSYLHASNSPACKLKIELCVPGILLAHNFSVATMGQPGAAIVRPEFFCSHASHEVMLKHDPRLSCGRSYLGSRKQICATDPRVYNMTARMQFWSSTARAERSAARSSAANNNKASPRIDVRLINDMHKEVSNNATRGANVARKTDRLMQSAASAFF